MHLYKEQHILFIRYGRIQLNYLRSRCSVGMLLDTVAIEFTPFSVPVNDMLSEKLKMFPEHLKYAALENRNAFYFFFSLVVSQPEK